MWVADGNASLQIAPPWSTITMSLRNKLVATLALLASSAPALGQCVDFDSAGGSYPCCGATFVANGIGFETHPFIWASGTPTTGGSASIMPGCDATTGNALWPNNVNVAVKIADFYGDPTVKRIQFRYENSGGNVNLRINGSMYYTASNFHLIPPAFFTSAGVVNVSPPPVWTGSSWVGEVIIEAASGGCISEFGFGGQELCVDDICAFDPCPCPEDLNGDGVVSFPDVLALLAAWGPCTGCPEDLDGDLTVGFGDLILILTAWGPC